MYFCFPLLTYSRCEDPENRMGELLTTPLLWIQPGHFPTWSLWAWIYTDPEVRLVTQAEAENLAGILAAIRCSQLHCVTQQGRGMKPEHVYHVRLTLSFTACSWQRNTVLVHP